MGLFSIGKRTLRNNIPNRNNCERVSSLTFKGNRIFALVSLLVLFDFAISFSPLSFSSYVGIHGGESRLFASSSFSSDTHLQQIFIVGGGVGGLATAARIAGQLKTKAKITLLEKNKRVGGRCGSFWVDPGGDGGDPLFRHEEGPSLLLLPQVYQDVFTDATEGVKTAFDYGLDMIQCVPAYQVVFDDGDVISVGFPENSTQKDPSVANARTISRAQMNTYEPNGAEKWDEYMAITAAYLDAGLPNFIEEKLDLSSLPEFLVQSLRGFGKAWPLKPHSEVLDALFESDKLKALASFQDLYVGLEPYKNTKLLGGGVLQTTAPAVFGLLAAIELHPSNPNSGVFAPKGGFSAVSSALETLATDLGVHIRCDTNVLKVTNDGLWVSSNASYTDRSSGSEEKAAMREFIPSDLTIINADLPYAKNCLLGKDKSEQETEITDRFDWDDSFSFSSGVISFYWSLDKPLTALKTHNVFLSTKSRSEAEASWEVLRRVDQTVENRASDVGSHDNEDSPFNFYVHRPSHTDPGAAPTGYDTIMVLVPCRTLLRDEECARLSRDQAIDRYEQQFTPEIVANAKQAVLKRFACVESLKDLEDHIIHEEYRTPATWANLYNLGAGTPFALSHGFAQLSLTRPGPASSGLSNVLFCGASTRPGNGVPLVLMGAKQVAEKAISILEKA